MVSERSQRKRSSLAGGIELEWNAFPGRSYLIEASDTLAPDAWETLETIAIPQGVTTGVFSHEINPMDWPKRFFRVRLGE